MKGMMIEVNDNEGKRRGWAGQGGKVRESIKGAGRKAFRGEEGRLGGNGPCHPSNGTSD